MLPDRQYRFILALADIPLAKDLAWDIAIQHAKADAEAAGYHPKSDPAVQLLKYKRRQKSASTETSEIAISSLKIRCRRRLDILKAEPTLALLAEHDFAANDALKKWFHAEARKALVAVMDIVDPHNQTYRLQHDYGGRFEPGSIFLAGQRFHIEVTKGRKHGGNVIFWRTIDDDMLRGDRPRRRTLFDLCKKESFAKWLHDQIGLIEDDAAGSNHAQSLDAESIRTQSEQGV